MRELIIDTYNLFTLYDAGLFFVAILLPLSAVSIYSRYSLKNRSVMFIYILTTISFTIIFGVFSYTLQPLFREITDGTIQIGFYIGYIIVLLSFMQLHNLYLGEMGSKRFDPDHVTRKQFDSLVDIGILLTVIFAAAVIFLSNQSRTLLLITLLSTLTTLAVSHLFARSLLQDRKKAVK